MQLLDAAAAPASREEIILFNSLGILGILLMAITLAPALFSPSHARRSKSWVGQIIAWIIYSGAFLMLCGRQHGPDPPFGICMFQAALIYAVPVLTAAASICFMFDFHFRLTSALFNVRLSMAKQVLPLVIPSVLFVYVFVEVSLLVQDPTVVQRQESLLYCHITTSTSSTITVVLVMVMGAILFPLQVWTTTVVLRNWATFKNNTMTDMDTLSLFIRFKIFTVTLAAGLILFIVHKYTPVAFNWNLALPAPPLLVWLAFGTQMDLINTWLFWLRLRRRPVNDPAVRACVEPRSNNV
ncbi:hypothetical protein BD779DRAFT_576134 [Infundibulicybe gibba]|nr:hypothetical protein BD779DRAFT_576134 [Infundibulicybe gibba]